MRVTIKGQVTIPKPLRDEFDIKPNSEVEFASINGNLVLSKKTVEADVDFQRFIGVADIKMSTDDLMSLTRGD